METEPISAELNKSEIEGSEHLKSSMSGEGGDMPVEKLKFADVGVYESIVSTGDIAERGVSAGDD